MRFTGFIGPSYTLKSRNVDCQRCINLYPEINELGTGAQKEVASLVSTPGLRTLLTLPTFPVRAEFTASNGRVFAVGGNVLYEISSSWIATAIGTLATSSGRISIADNGIQLIAVDGPNGYVYTFATNLFNQISDANFLGATCVSFLDGYFVLNKPNSQVFYITGLNAVTFNALDVSSSEGNPDNIVGLIAVHRELWVFNAQSIEVFYDAGGALFPFSRIQGAFIETGCAAVGSIASLNNMPFWIGRDDKGSGQVFRAAGYQPQRISTFAVELAIQSYGDISDCTSYVYQSEGHSFYVLNFPSANTTWAFDTTSNMWHERAYTNNGSLERHRADNHAFAFGTHIVGDYQNGKIYKLDEGYFSDDGVTITRRRTAPHVSALAPNGMNRIFYHKFQLDIEVGVGLDGIQQGTDPQVMLRFSDDGGKVWSNEKWASFGKIGQYRREVEFWRLGRGRDRVFEVTITDPVKVAILGAELVIEPGEE